MSAGRLEMWVDFNIKGQEPEFSEHFQSGPLFDNSVCCGFLMHYARSEVDFYVLN